MCAYLQPTITLRILTKEQLYPRNPFITRYKSKSGLRKVIWRKQLVCVFSLAYLNKTQIMSNLSSIQHGYDATAGFPSQLQYCFELAISHLYRISFFKRSCDKNSNRLMGNFMISPCGWVCLAFPRNVFISLYIQVCSVKPLKTFFSPPLFFCKTSGCNSGLPYVSC